MNKYILQDKLGSGGYSTVYKCVDKLGIRYACKVLSKANNKRRRVQQEVEMLKSLQQSTRVARLIDAREDTDNFYIIQEWCKGGMLRDYVGKHDMYGENTVASIIRGVLRGLYHIHEKGIVHRDIKGPNIMFADTTEDAEIRIIDFGVAAYSTNHLRPTDEMVGTPWFMAPEILGCEVGAKSDIWSVGVLTYQLLSGKMPFNDKDNPFRPSTIRIFRSVYLDEPNMSSKHWQTISDPAKDFVRWCLQKEYHKRPSAEEALQHIWLTSSDCSDRFTGQQLTCSPFSYENDSVINAATQNPW